MPRKNSSILEDLDTLPWWINIILAVVVYLAGKFVIPQIAFENPFLKGIAMAAPGLAPYILLILIFVAAISAFNAYRKGLLLDRQKGISTLREITWREFEDLVGEAYRRKGYTVTQTGGGGADGGIDLVLKRGGEKLLVQCKHWKMSKVGVKVVRELYGVISADGANGGIVISSGTFTREARDFAEGKTTELVDGSELLNLISEVQKKPSQLNFSPKKNICHLCGAEIVLRTAKKGRSVDNRSWGCSTFPKCRATKPYEAQHSA